MNNLTEQTQTQWPSAPGNNTKTVPSPSSPLPHNPSCKKKPFFTNNHEKKKKRKTKIKKHKQARKNKLNLKKKSKCLWKLNKFTR